MKTTNPSAPLKKIGHVSSAHGIKGEIYVLISSGDASWVNDLSELTLIPANEIEPQVFSEPIKIKRLKPHKKGFICSLENKVTRNQAEELLKFEVWVFADYLISKSGELPFLSELLDFTIEDMHLGPIGKVQSFSTNGIQDLLVLDKKVNSQDVEIPFIKEFVLAVDYERKIIKTELPEGLVNINEKD